MKKVIFINLSNHPLEKWTPEQITGCGILSRQNGNQGVISLHDIPFPNIDPCMTKTRIEELVDEHIRQIYRLLYDQGASKEMTHFLHIMGEMGFTFCFLQKLKEIKEFTIMAVHSTTERSVVENPDGSKTARFRFVQFRPY